MLTNVFLRECYLIDTSLSRPISFLTLNKSHFDPLEFRNSSIQYLCADAYQANGALANMSLLSSQIFLQLFYKSADFVKNGRSIESPVNCQVHICMCACLG